MVKVSPARRGHVREAQEDVMIFMGRGCPWFAFNGLGLEFPYVQNKTQVCYWRNLLPHFEDMFWGFLWESKDSILEALDTKTERLHHTTNHGNLRGLPPQCHPAPWEMDEASHSKGSWTCSEIGQFGSAKSVWGTRSFLRSASNHFNFLYQKLKNWTQTKQTGSRWWFQRFFYFHPEK